MSCTYRIHFQPSPLAGEEERTIMAEMDGTVIEPDEIVLHLLNEHFIRSLNRGGINRLTVHHIYGTVIYEPTTAPVSDPEPLPEAGCRDMSLDLRKWVVPSA